MKGTGAVLFASLERTVSPALAKDVVGPEVVVRALC
jgi:hypothetical protein